MVTSLGPMSSGKNSGRLWSMLRIRDSSNFLFAVSNRPVPLASPACTIRMSIDSQILSDLQ